MAKKSSNGRQLSATTKFVAAKRAATSAAALASSQSISSDQIGDAAGKVWHALAQQGGMNLTALKKAVDAPADLVLAAIGWLAREGKLDFSGSGRSVQISLR